MPVWAVGAWLTAQPISEVVTWAMSSVLARSSVAARRRTSARSAGGVRGHGPSSNAWRAAATARSTSAASASGTWPTTSSVEGETTPKRPVAVGSTHRPPMKNLRRSSRSFSTIGILRTVRRFELVEAGGGVLQDVADDPLVDALERLLH